LPKENAHRFPQFLPDGFHFLYLAQGVHEVAGIYLGSLDSTETKRINGSDAAGAFLPPDWLVFINEGRLVAQHFNLQTGELRDTPVTLADAIAYDSGLRAGAFSVSSAGTVAYRGGG